MSLFGWRIVLALIGLIVLLWAYKRRRQQLSDTLENRGFARLPGLREEARTTFSQCLFLDAKALERAFDLWESEDESLLLFQGKDILSLSLKELCGRSLCVYSFEPDCDFPLMYIIDASLYKTADCFNSLKPVQLTIPGRFQQRYTVLGEDKQKIGQIMTPALVRFLETNRLPLCLYLKEHVFICCFGNLSSREKFTRLLDKAGELLCWIAS